MPFRPSENYIGDRHIQLGLMNLGGGLARGLESMQAEQKRRDEQEKFKLGLVKALAVNDEAAKALGFDSKAHMLNQSSDTIMGALKGKVLSDADKDRMEAIKQRDLNNAFQSLEAERAQKAREWSQRFQEGEAKQNQEQRVWERNQRVGESLQRAVSTHSSAQNRRSQNLKRNALSSARRPQEIHAAAKHNRIVLTHLRGVIGILVGRNPRRNAILVVQRPAASNVTDHRECAV